MTTTPKPLTLEQETPLRQGGVAWCSEATFNEMWQTIDALRAKVAELEREKAVSDDFHAAWIAGKEHEHETDLTATRAALREAATALERLSRLGNGDRLGNSEGNVIAQEALRSPLVVAALAEKEVGNG